MSNWAASGCRYFVDRQSETMKKCLIWGLSLLVHPLLAQPLPDMPVGKYNDDATPYSLYAGIFGSSPTYDASAVRLLSDHFDGYYGNFDVSMATADAVRSRKSSFQFVKYQGAWQLTGSSRVRVEQQKDQVLHYRVGNLESAITTTQQTFRLNDLFGSLLASNSAPDKSIGYLENGQFRYVTWIRIGQEVMKLTNVTGSEVTVIRGFDNTTVSSHPAGAVVLSPVYGTPPTPGMKTEISYRNDEATLLRWDNLYASLDAEYQKNKGGIWIDIVVGNLSQVAVSGENVPANRIWDLKNQAVYDPMYRASRSEVGIRYMQDTFKAKHSVFPVIWGNNMLFPNTLTDARLQLLRPTTLKPRPLDGFAQENSYAGYGTGGNSGDTFQWTGYEEWQQNLRSIMFMGEARLAARPLLMDGGRDNGTFAKLPAERRHKLFLYGYASYLLGVKVEADNSIYTKLGLTPVVDLNGQISMAIDSCFTWAIGKPVQTLASENVKQYKLPNQDVWVRRFEKGIVLVNPTDATIGQIDLTPFGVSFTNPDTRVNFLTSISLPEHSGAILLTETVTGVEPPGTVTIWPNPARTLLTVSGLTPGKYILDLFNTSGSVLMSRSYDLSQSQKDITVPLEAYPAGMYIVQVRSVRNNRVNTVKRFVKES
jgi:hypothetical protein